jgi:hypothetical protein
MLSVLELKGPLVSTAGGNSVDGTVNGFLFAVLDILREATKRETARKSLDGVGALCGSAKASFNGAAELGFCDVVGD